MSVRASAHWLPVCRWSLNRLPEKTGANQSAKESWWTHGRSSRPPKKETTARTTSGSRMIHGDSCGVCRAGSPVRADLVPAGLAPEGQNLQPRHVVRREDGGQQAQGPQRLVVRVHVVQHVALGPEAGQGRDAGDGQPAHGEGDRGPLHRLAQGPHALEVLLVVEPVDDRAGPQEEQALEEGVGHHEEDGGDVGARADGQDHVADLRDGGEGEHLLDVLLRAGDGGGHEGGDPADDGDDLRARMRERQQVVHPAQQVDPGRHHGGGVDEGRDRRRALHGVGQPVEQRDLGRLAGGGEEEKEHGRRGRARRPGGCSCPKIPPPGPPSYCSVPVFSKIKKMASRKPASPMRL